VCVCVKTSRKGPSYRPPSSRSVSRQNVHCLTGAAVAVRPPSVFNKNPPLPPIGTTAPAVAASVSPCSDSSASVPLGLSATPAAETWSCGQSSGTLLPNVENGRVSPLADSIVLIPNSDSHVTSACSHYHCVPTKAPTVEIGSKHGSRHNIATASCQQAAESASLPADVLAGELLSTISELVVEQSNRQSGARPAGCSDSTVNELKSHCSLSQDDIVDLPLVSPGSGRLKVTDAACQCDSISSGVKCESGTQAGDDNDRQRLTETGSDDVSCSIAHPSSGRMKKSDWWSKELASAGSILGLSPTPAQHRVRSGTNSRTARKFHGLNAHEMQTVSTMLNTIARTQSRAGSDAAGGCVPAAGTNTAESRIPTTERVRLAVSKNDVVCAAAILCAFL